MSDESYFDLLPQDDILAIPGAVFVTKSPERYKVWHKAKSAPHRPLADVVDDDGIQRGVSPDLKSAFLVDTQTARRLRLEPHKLRRVLTGGRHVKRYFIEYPDLLLIYTTRHDDPGGFPNILRYIEQFKDQITCREVGQKKHPLYALHRPRQERIFLKAEKVLGVITQDEIVVAPDRRQTFATDGLYLFGVRESIQMNYVLGILNSRLFVFLYRLLALEKGRVLAQVKPATLLGLPIRIIDFDDPQDVARHDKMVALVERMLDLHKKLAAATIPADMKLYQRQIEATDEEIDALVYELYGLTEGEIEIVEGLERSTR